MDGRGRTEAPFGRRPAAVERRERIGAYDVLWVRDAAGPEPCPGQFYMLATLERWGGGEDERPFLPRAFSHCRAVLGGGAGPLLGFVLERVGPGTERLAQARPGEELWLTGPLGAGFAPAAPGSTPLLVGGGIGVAPLLCLQDQLGAGASVLLGFRSAEHAEVASLFAGDPRIATDDGSAGRHGLVTELLREELDTGLKPAVFACGPPAMLEAVRAICAERDIRAQLALESGMACGFGACMGCVVQTRAGYVRLCVDGPVLDAGDLDTALTPGAGH